MNVWLISTCELQIDLIINENVSTAKPRANPRLTKPVLDILLIYENFFRR